MSPLYWLIIPVAATLGAVARNAWRMRARPPVEAMESVQAYDRFREAIASDVMSKRELGPDGKGR